MTFGLFGVNLKASQSPLVDMRSSRSVAELARTGLPPVVKRIEVPVLGSSTWNSNVEDSSGNCRIGVSAGSGDRMNVALQMSGVASSPNNAVAGITIRDTRDRTREAGGVNAAIIGRP